ncbi:Uncharacterised protein [Citrobacter freundii]|nr:Uncharacterised protein [Citrobacter freundii]
MGSGMEVSHYTAINKAILYKTRSCKYAAFNQLIFVDQREVNNVVGRRYESIQYNTR